jgi:hypothetical protein
MDIEQGLTSKEKQELIRFVNSGEMMEAVKNAVKKICLSSIYFDQPFTLVGKSNSELGESLRAVISAVDILEDSFKKLEMFKKPKERIDKGRNPAR